MKGSELTKVLYDRLGQRGADIKKWAGLRSTDPYCCATVSYAMNKVGHLKDWCGGQKVVYVPTALIWMKSHWKHVSMADAQEGDVVVFTWSGRGYNKNPSGVSRDHIGFIRKAGTKTTAYTIEGNTSGGIVAKRERNVKYIHSIWRPSFVGTVTPEVVPNYPTVDLRKGAEGGQVKSLQICLQKIMAFKPALVSDGEFGPKTEQAVKDFQKYKKLVVDGIVGPKTRAAIKNALYPTKQPKAEKIIDVSYAQGDIDWAKVKADGVTQAYIRCGHTWSRAKFEMDGDSYFVKNIKGATAQGIKVGVYYFSQATTINEAKQEAEYVLKTIKPYKTLITLPVVFDWETYRNGRLTASVMLKNGKIQNTKICKQFCDIIKKEGYAAMVYANYSTFSGYLQYTTIRGFAKTWLAQYASKPSYTTMDLWQYTSSGKVKGISGNVDMSKVYK